jgi:hypothetical protein
MINKSIHTQSLNFRSLGIWFLVRIFGLNFPPDNEFPDIIFFCQVEEFANFAGSFRSKTFGVSDVGESRKVGIALFNNNNRKDGKIGTDDTTTDRLAFTFTSTTGTVARVAF